MGEEPPHAAFTRRVILRRSPDGGFVQEPVADSWMPEAELRERLWMAYAHALNTDEDKSFTGYGSFPEELGTLCERLGSGWPPHETPHAELDAIEETVRGWGVPPREAEAFLFDARRWRIPHDGVKAIGDFARRWLVRPGDVLNSYEHWRRHSRGACATCPDPRDEADKRPYLQLPIHTWTGAPGLAAHIAAPDTGFVYDLRDMRPSEARERIEAMRADMLRQVREHERHAKALGVRPVGPRHRDWKELLLIARRRVRHTKGWGWERLAKVDHVSVRTVRDTFGEWSKDLDSSVPHQASVQNRTLLFSRNRINRS